MISYLVMAVTGYGLGCLHPSYYFTKRLLNADIREHGSHNCGTSNATIVLGWKYGVFTAVIDVLKGTFTVLIARWLFGSTDIALLYFSALAAILGHMYPFYLKFKGGKGLATLMGTCIALNFWLTVILFVLLVAVTLLSDYIVIGTAVVCFVFAGYTIYQFGISLASLFALLMAGWILVKHRINYKRILHKTEIRFSSTVKGRKDKDHLDK